MRKNITKKAVAVAVAATLAFGSLASAMTALNVNTDKAVAALADAQNANPSSSGAPSKQPSKQPSQQPSQQPSKQPSQQPSQQPEIVLPTGSVEELTGTAWWTGMQVGKDYALNGDGSIELFVEVIEKGAFSVELVSAEPDGTVKYYMTTGSDKNAWTAEGAQGVGTISGVADKLSSDIENGHIYKITVTRAGQDITVAYYDATADTEYCTLKWTGSNMKDKINVHVMAQEGKYKVYTDAKIADPLPTPKPTAEPTAKPTAAPTAKPTAKPTVAPTKAPAATGKVTKVTVKVPNKKAGKTIYVKKGDKVTLKATVKGTGTFTKGVTYKSSKKKVATVSSKGVVKAKKAGTAKITVTSKFDKTKKATITVKVSNKKVANKKLTLKAKKKTLKKGKTYTVAIKSITKNTTEKITFKSSKKSVATVDQYGVVKAKKKGKATITVKCGKKKATLKLTVKK